MRHAQFRGVALDGRDLTQNFSVGRAAHAARRACPIRRRAAGRFRRFRSLREGSSFTLSPPNRSARRMERGSFVSAATATTRSAGMRVQPETEGCDIPRPRAREPTPPAASIARTRPSSFIALPAVPRPDGYFLFRMPTSEAVVSENSRPTQVRDRTILWTDCRAASSPHDGAAPPCLRRGRFMSDAAAFPLLAQRASSASDITALPTVIVLSSTDADGAPRRTDDEASSSDFRSPEASTACSPGTFTYP